MKSTDVTGWTDMSPDSRFRNRVPSTIITADEIANGEWDGLLGDVFNGGVEREVVYYDGTTKWWMVLTLYVHPAGAGAFAINPATAYAAHTWATLRTWMRSLACCSRTTARAPARLVRRPLASLSGAPRSLRVMPSGSSDAVGLRCGTAPTWLLVIGLSLTFRRPVPVAAVCGLR